MKGIQITAMKKKLKKTEDSFKSAYETFYSKLLKQAANKLILS